ncbi:MAG: hypothetical protein KF846_13785 [Cyclobacteriaceae bacterium]|nr:hypothetical protein [Cyclobacteriaceae bacterium]
MNQYEKHVSDKLLKEEFILGKDLNLQLQKKFGVTSPYGRKIIERAAKSKIIKPSVISFGNGQYAYIHPSKRFTKEIVLQIAKINRPPLFRLINMLDRYQGVLTQYEAMKICATPLKQEKTKSDLIHKLILETELLDIGLRFENSDGVKFIIYPSLKNDAEAMCKKEINRMTVDTAFIPDVLRALRKYNIIDNDRVLYRNKNTAHIGITHNNYTWDAIAYTKTTGINDTRSSQADTFDKQTLVALDIVISRAYSDNDLQGFVSRLQGMQSAVKTGKRKVLPVIIYAHTESKILVNRIRKLGFLCFDLGAIYGSWVYKIIQNVVEVKKTHSSETIPTDILVEKTLDIMRNAGQENNLPNIKGDLFESLMFPFFKLIFPDAIIEVGEKLKSKVGGKKLEYEYDYIIKSSRLKEVIIIELKGYSSSNYISLGDHQTQNTIKWFFGNTFPFAKGILQMRDPNVKITASYITTSSFKEDGVAFLASINNGKLKPNDLEVWYDGEKLMSLLGKFKLVKTQEIIKKYYIKEKEETDEVVDQEFNF